MGKYKVGDHFEPRDEVPYIYVISRIEPSPTSGDLYDFEIWHTSAGPVVSHRLNESEGYVDQLSLRCRPKNVGHPSSGPTSKYMIGDIFKASPSTVLKDSAFQFRYLEVMKIVPGIVESYECILFDQKPGRPRLIVNANLFITLDKIDQYYDLLPAATTSLSKYKIGDRFKPYGATTTPREYVITDIRVSIDGRRAFYSVDIYEDGKACADVYSMSEEHIDTYYKLIGCPTDDDLEEGATTLQATPIRRDIVNPIHHPDMPTSKEEIDRAFDILKDMCR